MAAYDTTFEGPVKFSYASDVATAKVRGVSLYTLDPDSGGNMAISNKLNGIPVAELQSVDPSQKVTFFDDFLAAALDGRISSTAGSGTGNAALTKVANSTSGEATLTSASDDGTHAANCSSVTLDETNFRADQGGLAMEVKLQIDDVSEAVCFVGFTDTISTTVELPIFLAAGAVDSDAANACGIVYDVDATTDVWTVGGVKANTDTAPSAGTATQLPADDVYQTLRVEVSAAGAVTGYLDGSIIGSSVAAAVTATTSLTPCVVIGNRSANQVIATIDYIWVQQDR